VLVEQDRRQRGDEDRRRQIKRDDIGERQVIAAAKNSAISNIESMTRKTCSAGRRISGKAPRLRQINGDIRTSAVTERSSKSSPTE
jgi:hypothetical protein